MRRIPTLLLVTLLAGLTVFSCLGEPEEKVSTTVEIRNSACSKIGIAQFFFLENGNPLGVKRFIPEKEIRKNQRGRFSFKLDGKPDRLVLSGSASGDEFTYRIGLNWGENVRETSCGRIIVTVPYKGGVKYPVARFKWQPGEPKTGEEVTLNAGDSIGNIQYYGWDFDGDGNVDKWTQDPITRHSWGKPGTYEVSLKVETGSGRSEDKTHKLKVVSSKPEPTELPSVTSLNCKEDAYFSVKKTSEYLDSTKSPPHEKCWGYYKLHTYPLERTLQVPVQVSKISASVTGGISELSSNIVGFKLQALSERDGPWETLTEFTAPCSSGKNGTLVQWKAETSTGRRVMALRILAPGGGNYFVDNSPVWIEHYGSS